MSAGAEGRWRQVKSAAAATDQKRDHHRVNHVGGQFAHDHRIDGHRRRDAQGVAAPQSAVQSGGEKRGKARGQGKPVDRLPPFGVARGSPHRSGKVPWTFGIVPLGHHYVADKVPHRIGKRIPVAPNMDDPGLVVPLSVPGKIEKE